MKYNESLKKKSAQYQILIDEFKNANFGVWGWVLNENVGKIVYIIIFFLIIAGCSMILLTGKL